MPRGRPPQAWVELRARVPVAAQELVNAWLVERGASGVQEEYPGLADLGEDGPIVSGDPRAWAGDAPENASDEVWLTAWLATDSHPEEEARALRARLGELDAAVPGCAAAEVGASRVEEQDWNAPWKELWRPTPVGRGLLICPSWLEPEPGETRRVLRLDPGMAFGTGTHFTTASCLEVLEEALAARAAAEATTVLDVGCGTGILGVACLLLGAARATGLDLDPDAVAEAQENAVRNGVEGRYAARCEPLGPEHGRADLVAANLVAETLIELAPWLEAALSPAGLLVVSGVLRARAAAVEDALRARGLTPREERSDGSWVTSAWTRA